MAVDKNIQKKANDIRTKQYGSEVRESLASGIEEISKDVVSTEGRQTNVEQQFQSVIDNTTGKDFVSAPEILASRVGADGTQYANTKARLDAEQNKTTAQLAHTDNKKADKTHVWSMSNMGQDVKESMTNGSVAVVGEDTVLKENIVDDQVSPRKTDFLEVIQENLFNPSEIQKGKQISVWDEISDNPDFFVSGFIPVELLTKYRATHIANKVFYDKDKSRIDGRPYESGPISMPTNTRYIRYAGNMSSLPNHMFVKGETVPSAFTPFGERVVSFKKIKFDQNPFAVKNPLYGKKWNVLGDSISAGENSYHKYIAQKAECIVRNYGISGSTIADHYTWETNPMVNRYLQMDADADIITVFGGVNDASGNMPMGDIESKDKTTFYGAMNVLLEGLIKKCPDKVIAVFTPTKTTGRAELHDIVIAIKEVCKKFAIPCLDLYNMSGLSTVPEQMAILMPDELHPNDLGQKRIAGLILSFLVSIMPLEFN